ncbi:MAG: hypothetical protein PHF84_05580 [bacterium]|nr:hypothetical protein [bacterium]
MKKVIFLLLLGKRMNSAVETQKVLTEFGCIIKTRLGLHNLSDNQCEESGLVILEVQGEPGQQKEFRKKLSRIRGVNLKIVELKI